MLFICWMFAAGTLCAPLITSTGCSNRAHSDLYQQRMAGEIRVLEDQLYDADFQNRKLQDKLKRYEEKVNAARIPTPQEASVGPHTNHPPSASDLHDIRPLPIETGVPVPVPDLRANEPLMDGTLMDEPTLDDGFEAQLADEKSPDELDIPNFDMGEAFDPNSVDDAQGSPTKAKLKSDSAADAKRLPPPRRKPLSDPKDATDDNDIFSPPGAVPPKRKPNIEFLPPPPGGAMPPGKRDLEVDPIIPGDLAPPPPSGEQADPPGRIELPLGVTRPTGVPERLRVHPTLSSGHRDGTLLDGATIVVAALDRLGRNVDLSQFDIEANMSVVVLDPTRDASEARLGRWDFTPAQVEAMIAQDPTAGLEIPLTWSGKTMPKSDKIVVHVRLRSDQDEMRCDAKLDLSERTAATTWTPRGE